MARQTPVQQTVAIRPANSFHYGHGEEDHLKAAGPSIRAEWWS